MKRIFAMTNLRNTEPMGLDLLQGTVPPRGVGAIRENKMPVFAPKDHRGIYKAKAKMHQCKKV